MLPLRSRISSCLLPFPDLGPHMDPPQITNVLMQLKLPFASRPARQAFVAVFELHLGEAPTTAADFLNTSCLGQAVIMQTASHL